jgi:hypothetical protein
MSASEELENSACTNSYSTGELVQRKGPQVAQGKRRHALPSQRARALIVAIDEELDDESLPIDPATGEPMERSLVIRDKVRRYGYRGITESQIDRALHVERRALKGALTGLRHACQDGLRESLRLEREARAEYEVA